MRTSGAKLERRPDGTLLVTPDEQLREYPKVLTDRVAHWAREFPDRVCIAKRDANGEWRRLTYAEIWESIRSVGQALLGFGLSAERPVMILSENDLEQFILDPRRTTRRNPSRPNLPAVLAGLQRSQPIATYRQAADSGPNFRRGWKSLRASASGNRN